MYTGDILGMGHVRRNTAIASRLIEEVPETNVLLVTGLCPNIMVDLPRGLDLVKLPSVRKLDDAGYGPRTLELDLKSLTRMRAALIAQIARHFRPNLLLVDHLPTGISDELLPTLHALKSRTNPPRVILGLRDFVDDPETTRRLWARNDTYSTIDRFYDAAMVYGCRDIFDTRAAYGLTRLGTTAVHYVGYLRSKDPGANTLQVRHTLERGKSRLIVVTAGGGADGYPMMDRCLEGLRQITHRADFEVAFVTGPFMPRTQRQALQARAEGLPARVHWCVDGLDSFYREADLIITMAGYNSLVEAIHLKKRLLVVPRPGPSAEQRLRAKIFAELGLLRTVPDSSLAEMGELILAALDAPPPTLTLPDMTGTENVVRRLRAILQEQASDDRQSSATATLS
jgi:predicted glycosyltransferase